MRIELTTRGTGSMQNNQSDNLSESKRKCAVLKTFIGDFKAKHPNLSSNQIAQRLNIPQSSLNRIENESTNPSLENVLSVLAGTGNHHRIPEILGEIFPNHKERFEKIFSANADTSFLDDVSSRYATDPETFLLVQMGFTRSGLSEREVRERFGSWGLEKLQVLIESGVLVRREDGLLCANEEKVNVTFADLKKIVCLAIEKCFDPELIDQGNSHLSYQTESVNEAGLQLILDELKKAQVNIRRIMYNPTYYGDHKVFASMVADQIVKNNDGVRQ